MRPAPSTPDRVREVFAAAAAGYDRTNALLIVERPETESLLPALAGKDMLDLGAGTGYYATLARSRGARRVLAVDFTPEMLTGAPRPALVADATRLPLRDASIDVVVAALLISYLPDRPRLFAEVARVLRPGGVVVVSDLHPVASARGWSRSFTGSAGERLVLDAPPANAAVIVAELADAGLALDTHREPVVDERLESEFRRVGRTDFELLRGTPLLVVIRARKGGPDAR